MVSYLKVKQVSPTDPTYIAGLVDGEGSIGLLRKHKGDNRQLVISISNNELSLLNFVLDVTGAGKITRKRSRSIRHKESYTYTITNRQALALLSQIARFLLTYKSKRAKLILANYTKLTPRNGKYSAELEKRRKRFIETCMAIKN